MLLLLVVVVVVVCSFVSLSLSVVFFFFLSPLFFLLFFCFLLLFWWLFLLSPFMFLLAFVKLERNPIDGLPNVWVWFGASDMAAVAAGAVALLVAMNVFLLGFLAELQVKVSKFFRHRIAVTSREAVR